MNFSEKILYLRKRKGLSRKDLAEALGLAYSTIAKYETNPSLPEMKTLKNISDFFDVSINYLMDNSITNTITETSAKGLSTAQVDTYDIYRLWKNIFALCLINKITIVELSILSDVDVSTVYNFYNGLMQPEYNLLERLFITLEQKNFTTVSDNVVCLDNLFDIDYIFSDRYITLIFKNIYGEKQFTEQIYYSSLEYAVYMAKAYLPQKEKDKINEIITAICVHYNAFRLSDNQLNIKDIKTNSIYLDYYIYSINNYINAFETNIKSLNAFFRKCISKYIKSDFEELKEINRYLSILDLYLEKYKNSYGAINIISDEDPKFYTHLHAVVTKYAQIETVVIKLYNLYEACVHRYLGDKLLDLEEKLFSDIFNALNIYI